MNGIYESLDGAAVVGPTDVAEGIIAALQELELLCRENLKET